MRFWLTTRHENGLRGASRQRVEGRGDLARGMLTSSQKDRGEVVLPEETSPPASFLVSGVAKIWVLPAIDLTILQTFRRGHSLGSHGTLDQVDFRICGYSFLSFPRAGFHVILTAARLVGLEDSEAIEAYGSVIRERESFTANLYAELIAILPQIMQTVAPEELRGYTKKERQNGNTGKDFERASFF